MPLIKKTSKKAFEHNVAAEMRANPSPAKRAQNLAIAYSVKKQAAKKKMAEGGKVDKDLEAVGNQIFEDHKRPTKEQNAKADKRAEAYRKANPNWDKRPKFADGGEINAKNERRPMPDNQYDDAAMDERNSRRKPNTGDKMTDHPTRMQALKGPKMAMSSIIKASPVDALGRRLDKEEHDLEMSDAPESDKAQPEQADDEMGADRQGPSTSSLKMKKMAEGGRIHMDDPDHDDDIHNMSVDHEYGDGAEEDMQQSPAGLEHDDDQEKPSDQEIMSDHMELLAEGGSVEHEFDDQPKHEEHEGMLASIASAIMSKLKAAAMLDSGSEDEDKAERMAEGGEVMGKSDSMFDIMKNNKEKPNFYPPRNGAALKENYNEDMEGVDQPEDSNEHGDDREDENENEHDRSVVGSIRRKMRIKSALIK